MSGPEQLAQKGIFYLEEAILDVLLKAWEKGEYPSIPVVDIKKGIGAGDWDRDQWLTATILRKLEGEGRVEQKGSRGPWQLTNAEYANRRDTESSS